MLDNKVKFEDLASLKNSFERVTKVLKDNPNNETHLKEFYSYYLSVFEPNHYYNQVYELSTSCNSNLLPNYEKLEFLKYYKNNMYLTRDLFRSFKHYTIDRIEHSIYFLEQVKKDFNSI